MLELVSSICSFGHVTVLDCSRSQSWRELILKPFSRQGKTAAGKERKRCSAAHFFQGGREQWLKLLEDVGEKPHITHWHSAAAHAKSPEVVGPMIGWKAFVGHPAAQQPERLRTATVW